MNAAVGIVVRREPRNALRAALSSVPPSTDKFFTWVVYDDQVSAYIPVNQYQVDTHGFLNVLVAIRPALRPQPFVTGGEIEYVEYRVSAWQTSKQQ